MKKRTLYNRREIIVGYAFIAPALLFMVLMIGYPMLYNIQMSLVDLNVMTFKNRNTTFQGLGNYIALFGDKVFLASFRNTFYFTIWCLIIQFSLGLMMALFFSRKFPLAGPIRGSVLISYMMPMSVTGLLFKNMFDTQGGVINYLLLRLGLIGTPVQWFVGAGTAMWTIIIANCWVGIPFNMLMLTAGLTNIPEDVYESAAIDGCGTRQRFQHITLPLLRPSITATLVLGFVYTFKVFDLVYIMTGGGPVNATQVLSTYAYKLSFSEYRYSMGAATGVVLFLCLLAVAMVYLNLIRKEEVA